ncbi:hypothetical protein [Leucobacter salsicius]
MAYILTRPRGATLGDLLSQPVAASPLQAAIRRQASISREIRC